MATITTAIRNNDLKSFQALVRKSIYSTHVDLLLALEREAMLQHVRNNEITVIVDPQRVQHTSLDAYIKGKQQYDNIICASIMLALIFTMSMKTWLTLVVIAWVLYELFG